MKHQCGDGCVLTSKIIILHHKISENRSDASQRSIGPDMIIVMDQYTLLYGIFIYLFGVDAETVCVSRCTTSQMCVGTNAWRSRAQNWTRVLRRAS